jgi:glycosyltransferase involved in cell wall biosynthesis
MQKRITAVIPAYNAEKTIGDIVKQCLLYCDEVIVVDDGSKDKTTIISKQSGAKVFNLSQNHGAGFATRFGMEAVWESEVVVTLDSDGQHDPKEIFTVCEPILNNKADLVIGSRFIGLLGDIEEYWMPKYRRLGIGVITLAYNFGHKPITDAQCCFRAFRVKGLPKIIPQSNRFGFSTEMLIRARKEGLRIKEVPITCKYRGLGQDSTMNPIKQGVSVLLDTIMWRLRLMN